MIARRARYAPIALVAIVLAAGGCSSAPPITPVNQSTSVTPTASGIGSVGAGSGTVAPTSSGAGEDSDAVSGRSGRYRVIPPEGWVVATEKAGSVPGIDLVLLSTTKVAGFSNNLVVLVRDGDSSTVADELDKGREQQGGVGGTTVSVPALTIGGERATGFATDFEQQGIRVRAQAYGLHHDGKVYLLTLSSSQQDAARGKEELDEIVAGWAWTQP